MREKKVKDYQEKSRKKTIANAHLGKLEYGKELDFKNTFI
jgi:hypothetical protein